MSSTSHSPIITYKEVFTNFDLNLNSKCDKRTSIFKENKQSEVKSPNDFSFCDQLDDSENETYSDSNIESIDKIINELNNLSERN